MEPQVSLFLCSATYIFVWGQPCIFLRQLQPSGNLPACSCVTSQGSSVITQRVSAERALLCCITFINHRAGSFSVIPGSMARRSPLRLIASPKVYFPTYLLRGQREAETEGEKGEILGAWAAFFNLLLSCIGTGVSSAGIKNPDRVMEFGADPEGG